MTRGHLRCVVLCDRWYRMNGMVNRQPVKEPFQVRIPCIHDPRKRQIDSCGSSRHARLAACVSSTCSMYLPNSGWNGMGWTHYGSSSPPLAPPPPNHHSTYTARTVLGRGRDSSTTLYIAINLPSSGLTRFQKRIFFHGWESCTCPLQTRPFLSQYGLISRLREGVLWLSARVPGGMRLARMER